MGRNEDYIRTGKVPKIWQEILVFVTSYKKSHGGDTPSYRTVISSINISSTSVLHYYLLEMDKAGLIDLAEGRRRGILITGEKYIPPPGFDTE